MKKIGALFLITLLVLIVISSCYKNNEEELYAGYNEVCEDTTEISYSLIIKPMLSTSCDRCHNTANAPVKGNDINLDGPTKIKDYEKNFPGSLLGSLRHEKGYARMPKGSTKFTACNIKKIEVWMKEGFQDN
jgi:hypothetical protein